MTTTSKIVTALKKETLSAKQLSSRYKLNPNTTRKCLGWLRANGFIGARARKTARNKTRLVYFTTKRQAAKGVASTRG